MSAVKVTTATPRPGDEYRFIVLEGKIDGFFVGRLPMPGEAVDLICTEITESGNITLQLKVREGNGG